ncbi:MAG: ketoacyl-ACP synthase III [Planctomycetes bacterium]|nr:ketoacyl-ACP synthase III [Planctomycetota bacterium]
MSASSKVQYRAQCVAVSSALPEKRLTNADIEKLVDTNDEWIVSRTGIRERRIAEPGTPLSHFATIAAKDCLEKAGVNAAEIDGIIIGTVTGDHLMPTTANIVQKAIGADNAFAYDLANACNGFVAALSTATSFIESGHSKKILVFGGDIMSSVINYEDRNTCILFGDGCGCVLLEAGPADGPGIFDFELHSDGAGADTLILPSPGSAVPISEEAIAQKKHYITQDGRAVFPQAVRRMTEVSGSLMEKFNLSNDDIDILVPHQANLRIIEPIARRLNLSMDKVIVNIDRVANTTAGTIPLALHDAERAWRLNDGTRVFLVAFGGGFSWGALYLTWGRG